MRKAQPLLDWKVMASHLEQVSTCPGAQGAGAMAAPSCTSDYNTAHTHHSSPDHPSLSRLLQTLPQLFQTLTVCQLSLSTLRHDLLPIILRILPIPHERLTAHIIAMSCQLLVWLHRRMMPWGRRPRARRHLPSAHARNHAPTNSRPRNRTPRPSYDNLFPRRGDGTEDLETIRARHPPKRPLNGPIPTDSPVEAAYLAGATALIGLGAACQDETHPCLIVARAAQAISAAASASQSYAALLAAVHSMELHVLLGYEEDCAGNPVLDDTQEQILVNMMDTVIRRSLAQALPFTPFVPHHELQSAGLVHREMTLADRAILEACILNSHIIRPSQQ